MKFKAVTNEHRQLDLNWQHINLYLSRWKPGTPFEVEITRRQKTKSTPMRKYYFSTVLPPFMENQGYDPDEKEEFHEHLKIIFFQVEPDKRGFYRKKDVTAKR